MPVARRRLGASLVAILSLTIILGATVPVAAGTKDPPGRATFMRALAHVESGGRYTARNPYSGAYGKYQIMPYMWRAWSRQYFGNANLRPTPANQERLARAVITAAYWRYGSWPVVAHYWLTGRGERDSRDWSPRARAFVNKVMRYYRAYGGAANGGPAPGSGGTTPPAAVRTVPDTSDAIRYRGGWSTAAHRSYSGGRVHWSERAGATATLTFTGRGVSWIGPTGPTRGQARVLVDGRRVTTIDLRSARYRPRNTLFTASFDVAGPHTLTIEVVGTRGRPVVAIDAFVVRR